jgi:hypothetical protein
MRIASLLRSLTLVALLAGTALLGSTTLADDKKEGFSDLFNGKDLTGWKFMLKDDADPAKTFSVHGGVIICTGHPNGYFYTDKSHKNYVLFYDWQYKRPANLTEDSKFSGNSGCLVHIQLPHKVWPRCVEVQGMNKNHGQLIFIQHKANEHQEHFDKAAKDKAVKPVGEWNTTEIVCKDDGSISAKINGTEVSSGKGPLTEGPIGFQSEGAEIHFRNIKIKEMK